MNISSICFKQPKIVAVVVFLCVIVTFLDHIKALKTSRFKHLLEVGRVFLTETDSHGRYRESCDRASASAMHREENCQSVEQTATLFTTNSATI